MIIIVRMKVKRHYIAAEVPRSLKEKLAKMAKAEARTLAQFVRIKLNDVANTDPASMESAIGDGNAGRR
jgi:hypothetical protein